MPRTLSLLTAGRAIAPQLSALRVLEPRTGRQDRRVQLQPLYNSRAWTERTRPEMLRLFPVCSRCRSRACLPLVVDHVVPRDTPHAQRDHDLLGLQVLGRACHTGHKHQNLGDASGPQPEQSAASCRDWRTAKEIEGLRMHVQAKQRLRDESLGFC